MKEYRIQIFHDNTSDNMYFDSREEAISVGQKELAKSSVVAVFLLKRLIDDKYDVEMQIE